MNQTTPFLIESSPEPYQLFPGSPLSISSGSEASSPIPREPIFYVAVDIGLVNLAISISEAITTGKRKIVWAKLFDVSKNKNKMSEMAKTLSCIISDIFQEYSACDIVAAYVEKQSPFFVDYKTGRRFYKHYNPAIEGMVHAIFVENGVESVEFVQKKSKGKKSHYGRKQERVSKVDSILKDEKSSLLFDDKVVEYYDGSDKKDDLADTFLIHFAILNQN